MRLGSKSLFAYNSRESVRSVHLAGKRDDGALRFPVATNAEIDVLDERKHRNRCLVWLLACVWVAAPIACTGISIDPTCPETLQVGESGEIHANELNPGGIASYLWEVFPEGAGTFAAPFAPDTTFQALDEGPVVVRMTARDGLYLVIDECRLFVSGFLDVAVSLTAEPFVAVVGEPVTLTCAGVGSVGIVEFVIEHLDNGDPVDLVEVSPGVVEFTPTTPGEYDFSCVGTDVAGTQGSSSVTVTVETVADPGAANGNDNADDVANANDNAAGGANENDAIGESANVNDNIAAPADGAENANESNLDTDNGNVTDEPGGGNRNGSGRP